MARDDAKLLKEARWDAMLQRGLEQRGARAGEGLGELDASLPTRVRLELAQELKSAGVPYRWIVERLGFASVASLRVRLFRMKHVTM